MIILYPALKSPADKVVNLSAASRFFLLLGSFLLLSVHSAGQFSDEYYVPDSMLIFSYSSESDSTCLSRTFYVTNDQNLTTGSSQYKLDVASSTWFEFTRKAYSFNPFGLPDTSSTLTKNGISEDWVNSSAYAIEYDDLDRIIMRADYTWNVTGAAWQGMMKRVFEYDEHRHLVYDATYGWDTNNNEWKGYLLKTWEMSPEGVELSQTDYSWDEVNKEWIGSSKVEHLTEEPGVGPYDDIYHWDAVAGDWYLYDKSRSEETLDGEGRPTETLFYNWDFGTEDWMLTAKNSFHYASQGDTIYEEFYFWQYNAWAPGGKENRIFDAYNNLVYFEHYNWNSILDDYLGTEKYISAFNASGQKTYQEDFYWDQNSHMFEQSSKRLNGFNPDGSPAYSYAYNWDQIMQDWKIIYRFYYYYTLSSELPAPQLTVAEDTVGKYEGIEFICSQDARVFLVPAGTLPGDDLDQVSLGAVDVLSLENGIISTSAVTDSGVYVLYAKNADDMVSLGKKVWITLPATSISTAYTGGFRIYPTLADRQIIIESDLPVMTVELYDLQGRPVRAISVEGPVRTVDISDLTPGIYFAIPDHRNDHTVMILKHE